MDGYCDSKTFFAAALVACAALLLLLDAYHEDSLIFSTNSVSGLSAGLVQTWRPIKSTSATAAKAILEHNPREPEHNNESLSAVRVYRKSKVSMVERDLQRARAIIRRALVSNSTLRPPGVSDGEYVPFGGIYRNSVGFHWSYKEMEKRFKVFIYEEGEPPLVHSGPCSNIYTTEGRFIHQMEIGNRFMTKDPGRAHAFFLPFSVVMMVSFLYKPDTYDVRPLQTFVGDYINVVSSKHPFWNRSFGADHFMLSCHDWGPHASRGNSDLYTKSIRVLCNANSSEGFDPRKDVSLPEMNIGRGISSKALVGGPSALRRTTLAFFAGGNHGPVRPILLKEWKDKRDPDMQVHEYLPKKGPSYRDYMRQSKFCLCPSGYEVASPRIVEAIYSECVPVIISEHYVLPFSDVLHWDAFSVQVSISDIPNLKTILQSIPQRKYVAMQKRVKQVQIHFMINHPSRPYDMFHMILHSVWLRRLNVEIPPSLDD